MAKNKGRTRLRPFSGLRRRRSSILFMGPRGVARKGRSVKRKHSRSKKAADATFKVREVPNTKKEPYEYVVYLFTKQQTRGQKLENDHKAVVEFVKSCIADYKIYKGKLDAYPEAVGVNCIKLATESDLMMLMLCHREHVRKIFKLVNEPT
jgi:hypothetical protein